MQREGKQKKIDEKGRTKKERVDENMDNLKKMDRNKKY